MARKSLMSVWARSLQRSFGQAARSQMQAGAKALKHSIKSVQVAHAKRALAPGGPGDWLPGVSMGAGGARQFRVYRPPGVLPGERLPLLVMLHGCGQSASSFAQSSRMNALAARERCLLLYPEQDLVANPQGCWNWFATRSGKAQAEVALIMRAIDQVCLLYPVDPERVAVAGMSAGASMAALLATQHPERFKAVVMHSGVPPGEAHSSLTALGAMHGRRKLGHANAKAEPKPGGRGGVAWPPLLLIHGRQDSVVSPDNAQAAVQLWCAAARLSAVAGAAAAAGDVDVKAGPARRSQRGQRYAMTTTDYKLGARTVVSWVEVDRLAHAWSGGAKSQAFSDPLGPDASRMVWRFVLKQFSAAK
ncbi:PHB depolymerase family esterase [Paucibacter sp. TC2R-5]|uniref:extracellular catalytic domain type 1 short-chain-length polyhydroxyalkanoate depolymerase n=1 Tax=Paucibacter sp. TC2R-5 TaxID=2893555 RepID=UPI0021E4FCE4|nr:PHB depolymerase family esterase [Paucibacter sp. TC2R-5]MCV2360315.1 PHB depolymerase family esterase [Paucibacter sp. TC2R-5]